MERSRLELLLEQELLQNAQQARILCGSPVTRFVRSVQTAGGVAAVRESCRRNRPSGAFDSLVQAGRLDLSAEASASYMQTSIMATAILAMRLRLQPTEYFVI